MSKAKLRVLGLPEALLRGREIKDVFCSEIDDRDKEVSQKLGHAVKEMAREHPHANWYLPLGVGGHVDHRIAREVASAALKDAGVRSVWFYEELFYAAETATPASGGQMKAVEMKWKMELCRVYFSQFTAGRLKVANEYAERLGNGKAVERVWDAAL